VIVACVLLLDFFTKQAIHDHLPLRPGFIAPRIPLFEGVFNGIDCEITHTENMGAAWGIFAAFPHALLYFRMIFIAVTVYYTLFFAEAFLVQPLMLIVAGAIGNVIDYFMYGHVIDMIHFRFWGYDYPVFNIADSSICTGVFWIFLKIVMKSKNEGT